MVCLIGILVSSSSQAIYGEAIWSPIDLLNKFLDDNPSHSTRLGVCVHYALTWDRGRRLIAQHIF